MTISMTKALFGEAHSPDGDLGYILDTMDSIVDSQQHNRQPELLRLLQNASPEVLRGVWYATQEEGHPDKMALYQVLRRHAENDTRPDWWRNMSEGDEDLLTGGDDEGTEQLEMQLESDLCELAAEQKAGIIKATLKITKGLFQAPKGKKVDYLLDAGWPYIAALVDAKGAEWLDAIITKFVTPRDPAAGEAASAAAHAAEQGGTKEDFEAAWNEKRGADADPETDPVVDDEEAPTEKKTETLTDGQLSEANMRWMDMAGISYVQPKRKEALTESMDIMPMGPASGGSHSTMASDYDDAGGQTHEVYPETVRIANTSSDPLPIALVHIRDLRRRSLGKYVPIEEVEYMGPVALGLTEAEFADLLADMREREGEFQ